MKTETARQAYIRLLRKLSDATDSLAMPHRDVVLISELIKDECLDGTISTNSDGFPTRTETMGIKPKGRFLLEKLEKEELAEALFQQHREAFKSIDRQKISEMEEKTLAEWQSNFDQNEPEWRLAEYEWQRRITAKQIRAGRWTTGFALLGVVIGAFLQSFLSSWHPFNNQIAVTAIHQQTNADSKINRQQPETAPIQNKPKPILMLPPTTIQTNLTPKKQ
jgi:hypothetical protein